MKMKIAVTGGAGFIGSHLIDALLKKGQYRVSAIDNLSMGKIENIQHNMKNKDFEFHNIDVRDINSLEKACNKSHIIVHLAALKIPRYGNTLETLEVNGKGMWNVLEIARKYSSQVIIASTSDVYGKSKDFPFSESGNLLLGPSVSARWSYAVSKLYDEHLCLAYQDTYKVPVTIVRIFGSYGPRHHLSWWGGPQSVFISAVLKNEEIEIHGSGRQTRSFAYISDTISGFMGIIKNEKTRGEIFNIGSIFEISIIDFAKLIFKLIDNSSSEPKFKFVPYTSFSRNYEDVMRRVPDLSKAEKAINFKPLVSLEEGLKKTIKWQKKILAL